MKILPLLSINSLVRLNKPIDKFIALLLTSVLVSFCCQWTYGQVKETQNVVGTSFVIESELMNDQREIQVFLPVGYDGSDKKHPVLYMLDGQHYFLHGVSLQQSFVGFKQTPEFIVVGISKNSSDRNRNFSVNATQYLEYVRKEVIDFVDTQFRTSKKRLLFGWAYAGGFVLNTLINQPDLFDVYIAASPFPLKGKINLIDSLLNANPNLDGRLFFTSATNEGVVKEGTEELNELLLEEAPPSLHWTYKELEDEEHRSTPFTTLYHGIIDSFEYYQELQFNNLEEFMKAGGLEYVNDYYQKRADEYGFSKELTDWTMFSLTRNAIRANDFEQFKILVNEFDKTDFMKRLRISRSCLIAEFYLENKKYEKAIEFFKLLAAEHPKSSRPLKGLGNAYRAKGSERQAAEYYGKAEELEQSN